LSVAEEMRDFARIATNIKFVFAVSSRAHVHTWPNIFAWSSLT
jgi:hypothetical protein